MPDSLCYRWALDTLSAQGTWPLDLPHDHNPEASGVVVHSARESSGPDSVKQLAVACINRGGTRQEVDHSLAWTEFHVPVLSAFYIGALTTVKQILSTGNVWTQGVVPTPEDVRRLVPQVRGVPDVISRVPGLKKNTAQVCLQVQRKQQMLWWTLWDQCTMICAFPPPVPFHPAFQDQILGALDWPRLRFCRVTRWCCWSPGLPSCLI